MRYRLRYFSFLLLCASACIAVIAQGIVFKDLHKVKRKETIFGIARENGLTVEELIRANPEMNTPGYELKKGDYIKIPFPQSQQPTDVPPTDAPSPISMPTKPESGRTDLRQRAIRVGIMLPLHVDNNDGKRMTEYYRGILMACDSLRHNGISTDIHAWNLAEDTDVNKVLADPAAADLDLIVGPLYSKQVKPLADFASQHDIRLMIPFSINSDAVKTNSHVNQVFQNGYQLNAAYVEQFMRRFHNAHTVIIDCNDSTSTKGGFTTTLRRRLESEGVTYSITNLRSSENMFLKSFSATMPNVVVLNTSRSAELNVAFAKLSGMLMQHPETRVSMFGYTEWLMYSRQHLENFYKFDTYVPSTYYTSPLSQRAAYFRQKYHREFRQDMQSYHARFAMTGFDHAYFMLKGLHLRGKDFAGAAAQVGYTPLQSPLSFERIEGGGLQNRAILLVHYTRDNKINVE